MKYQLKNIAGETRTIAGVDVADQGFLIFLDETALSSNIVAAVRSDAPNLTQMFSAGEVEYYEDEALKTQADYVWVINGMQPLASLIVENKWDFLARSLEAQSKTVTGSEYLEVESYSSGWKEQTSRIKLPGDRTAAPSVIIVGAVDYINTNGLQVSLINKDWFEVTYNAKGDSDGLTCSVSFDWEATYA